MYESEVNAVRESIASLAPDIRQRFAEMRDQIEARSLLPWSEHCTECNWPVCYSSCELYSPRRDGACRLFVDGMVRLDHPQGANPYVLKIRFKRWGKLWANSVLNLVPMVESLRKERANIVTGGVARALPLPRELRHRVLRKVAYWRRLEAEAPAKSPQKPDCFMVECYNPNDRVISLTLTIRPGQNSKPAQSFQQMIALARGFNRAEIPIADLSNCVSSGLPFEVEMVPNQVDDTVLYFGIVDFVRRKQAVSTIASPDKTQKNGPKWKCIVWDLDNTLWDGVLIEDGPQNLRLRQRVVDVIRETDQRGILHSIASKNNRDDALKFLRMCGIEDYFLHPQISWEPKSQSIRKIAAALNIGIDSLAFVDDQPFEREEVSGALPQVTVVDAADSAAIPTRDECQVPVTEESRSRRILYQQQEQRNSAVQSFNGDYKVFLKGCNIRTDLASLDDQNLERVYELAQRTNQMNFSGNRYPREALRDLMKSENKKTFVIKCEDKFGSYGIVGFSVVDINEPRLLDLMFSCRIQSKRVEHAFLTFLLHRFAVPSGRDFFANYRKTSKNIAAGKVFEEIGFELERENEGLCSLVFRGARPVPDDGIIQVSEARHLGSELTAP